MHIKIKCCLLVTSVIGYYASKTTFTWLEFFFYQNIRTSAICPGLPSGKSLQRNFQKKGTVRGPRPESTMLYRWGVTPDYVSPVYNTQVFWQSQTEVREPPLLHTEQCGVCISTGGMSCTCDSCHISLSVLSNTPELRADEKLWIEHVEDNAATQQPVYFRLLIERQSSNNPYPFIQHHAACNTT